MRHISVSFQKLMNYRRQYNLDIYASELKNGDIELTVQANYGILMFTVVSWDDPDYLSIQPFCNIKMPMSSLMLRTHDFSDQSSWPSPDNSLFSLIPDDGCKLVITSIVARCPANLDLSSNHLCFNIYKSYDGINPVTDSHQPVVSDVYRRMSDVINISNSDVNIIPDPLGLTYQNPVYQIKFRYTDSETKTVSKLSLSSVLNERLDVFLSNNDQLITLDGDIISDNCYLFFNTKRTPDV